MDFFKKMEKQDRYVLCCCFYAFFVSGFFSIMMGSIMPMLRAEYNVSEAAGGYLLSAHSLGNLIASFIYGLLPLMFGYKRSVIAINSLAFIGFTIMVLTGNYWALLLAFIFTGMGRGAISNFNNGTVARVSNSNPMALNLLHCFFAVGAFISPYVALVFTRSNDGMWKGATLFIVALGCVSLLAMSRMQLANNYPDKTDGKIKSVAFMKSPSFLVLCAMLFFYMCVETSINGWLVSYLKESGVMSVGYAQVLASLLWLIILVGRLTCGMLSKRMDVRTLLLVISIGAVFFFVLLLMSTNVVIITFCIIGLGFCMAGVCPLINAQAGPYYGIYSMSVGMTLVIGSCGSILMPSIVGVVAGSYGFAGGMSTITVAVVLLVVMAVFNRFMRPSTVTEA